MGHHPEKNLKVDRERSFFWQIQQDRDFMGAKREEKWPFLKASDQKWKFFRFYLVPRPLVTLSLNNFGKRLPTFLGGEVLHGFSGTQIVLDFFVGSLAVLADTL